MKCQKCGQEVVHIAGEGSLADPSRGVACSALGVAVKLPSRQPILLADGSLVHAEAGTTLLAHVVHGPVCPGRWRSPGS